MWPIAIEPIELNVQKPGISRLETGEPTKKGLKKPYLTKILKTVYWLKF